MALRHKYGAKPTTRHGQKFRSKLEANCCSVLEALKARGEILFYLRETRFDLPGNIKHNIDFTVFTSDHVYFLEAKGRDLALGKGKRQQVENLYGVEVNVVTKPEQIYGVLSISSR